MAVMCTNCGAPAEAGDRFCGACGSPLAAPTVLGVADSPPAAPPQVLAAPSSAPPREPLYQEASPSAPEVYPPPIPGYGLPPEAPQPSPDAVVVKLPEWLGSNWQQPIRLALLALGAGIALQYALSLVLLVGIQALLGDLSGLDWGATAKAPGAIYVAFHGPIEGVGPWLTGLLWIWISFRLASRGVQLPDGSDIAGAWAFVGKAALIYTVPLTVLAAVLRPDRGISGISIFDWNVGTALFSGLVISTVATLALVVRQDRVTLSSLCGLPQVGLPPLVTAAFAGAHRTLFLGILGLLGLACMGLIVDAIDAGISEFTGLVAALLSILLLGVVWAGVDAGFAFFVSSMGFLSDDFARGFLDNDPPLWMWFGIAIVLAVFIAGGWRAAEDIRAGDGRTALIAASLVGPAVGVISVLLGALASIVTNVVQVEGGGSLAGRALGLSLLWSIAAALGGVIYANKHGLSLGIRFEVQNRGPGASD